MGFGKHLQKLRERAGLSQTGLAEHSGQSLRSIQNWEQGHRAPRAAAILALARALGVSAETLLTYGEVKPPAKARKRT
jgi:transcriptional regulator with XRE-family HTH domain